MKCAMDDNIAEFTVTELSQALKKTVEDGFGYVRVRAELSGFKLAASGHMYMALKDEKSVLDAVCWRGTAGRLSFKPEDGLEVVCTGKLTTYPARSKYQMVVDHMEPAGAGALMALLEERKKKLAAEGLFAEDRKHPLPFIPNVIGVVTSPTGAVIRDILHRLSDRFPRHVIVWPVVVQGEAAAGQIAAAIRGFNALQPGGPVARPDLLIVARGGGSLEDLWSFNEEEVVRAAAESDIPLISAVGHETDTTLIDYASDRRAPTPTAAAEMAVPVLADLKYTIADLDNRLDRGRRRMFEHLAERLKGLARGLPSPRDILGLAQQRVDDLSSRLPRALDSASLQWAARLRAVAAGLSATTLKQSVRYCGERLEGTSARLPRAIEAGLSQADSRFQGLARLLDSMSHRKVLERGFALVYDPAGKPVTDAACVTPGDALDIEFRDGRAAAEATGETAASAARVAKPAKPKPPKPAKASKSGGNDNDDKQGTLL